MGRGASGVRPRGEVRREGSCQACLPVPMHEGGTYLSPVCCAEGPVGLGPALYLYSRNRQRYQLVPSVNAFGNALNNAADTTLRRREQEFSRRDLAWEALARATDRPGGLFVTMPCLPLVPRALTKQP
jgi:hypothetical protein